MLNVHVILSLSVVKLTVKIGPMTKDTTAAAVLNLMFGKLINGPMPTLLMCAQFQDITDAKEMTVETENSDKTETATKTDAI
jgi:hypothetical protein